MEITDAKDADEYSNTMEIRVETSCRPSGLVALLGIGIRERNVLYIGQRGAYSGVFGGPFPIDILRTRYGVVLVNMPANQLPQIVNSPI